ncbi:MAG: histidinol-phosphatase [Rhodospirillales bacterium]|jgi:inositol-phosphate phosphatase/L-galactose 1-phosphate phosphatase/histidinol-phosphatase|nr:histidinol-phosphatase [Rhodospirillales bacterium]
MSDIERFVALAETMADAVRPRLAARFRDDIAFDIKDDSSPVTIADREAEHTIRTMIAAACPDHGVLGEEEGGDRLGATWVWVIDPIDGTKSFVSGKPLFGTLIALLREGRPVLGIIEMPALAERFVGAEGRATTWNGQPVRVRPCPQLARGWLYATSPQMFAGANAAAFERLRAACYTAVYGADLYAYGLIARGRVDLVCEGSLKPYDYCAAVPIIEGAGGIATDWQGRPLGLDGDGRVLAAGDRSAHAAALAVLAG